MKKLSKQEIGIRKLIEWSIAHKKAQKAKGLSFFDDFSDEGKVELLTGLAESLKFSAWLGIKR